MCAKRTGRCPPTSSSTANWMRPLRLFTPASTRSRRHARSSSGSMGAGASGPIGPFQRSSRSRPQGSKTRSQSCSRMPCASVCGATFRWACVCPGGSIAGFHLMKLAASNGVKVVLNGQGSDEILAGYPSYFPDHWYTLLRTAQVTRAWHEIQEYAAWHGASTGQLFLRSLGRLFHQELRRLPPYRRLAGGRRWRRFTHKGWFAPYLLARHAAPDEGYQDSHLNAVLRRSVEQARLPHYLRLEDRNSMAHGLEARLPFMDYRLVSLAFRVPADQKMQGAWNKLLLRRSVRGRVPA